MRIRFARGFTLVEIMIVLVIVSIVIAITIPNYFKLSDTSKKNVCIANMRLISVAVGQWALDNNVSAGVIPSAGQENDIYADYIKGGRPRCPSGGVYTIQPVGGAPAVRCSRESEGHGL